MSDQVLRWKFIVCAIYIMRTVKKIIADIRVVIQYPECAASESGNADDEN